VLGVLGEKAVTTRRSVQQATTFFCLVYLIPKETTTPVPVLGESGLGSGRKAEVDLTNSPRVIAPGSAEEKAMWKNKRENKLRLIKEIAASQLLQEELAKTDPNLVSVASFLSKVCGTDEGARHLKETAGLLIREGGKGAVVAETVKRGADRDKKEVAGTDAVAILSSRLSGGYEGPATASEPSGDSVVIPLENEETGLSEARVIAIAEDARGLNIPEVEGTIASDVILPSDNVMSMGSSTDASPDHTSSRREFPGRVTRSAAGCRVYIHPPVGDEDEWPGRVLNPDGTIIQKVTLGQEGGAGTGYYEDFRRGDDVPVETVVTPDKVADEIGDVRVLPTILFRSVPSSHRYLPCASDQRRQWSREPHSRCRLMCRRKYVQSPTCP